MWRRTPLFYVAILATLCIKGLRSTVGNRNLRVKCTRPRAALMTGTGNARNHVSIPPDFGLRQLNGDAAITVSEYTPPPTCDAACSQITYLLVSYSWVRSVTEKTAKYVEKRRKSGERRLKKIGERRLKSSLITKVHTHALTHTHPRSTQNQIDIFQQC